MSTLEVNKLAPLADNGTVTLGDSGDTITIPTGAGLTVTDEIKTNKISPATGTAFTLGDSGDTFTIPSGATITNNGTASGFSGGITEADVYRLDTSFTGDATPINGNLERDHTSGFAKIGTGVTHSSGVFSFPSTGIYLVRGFIRFYVNTDSGSRFNRLIIENSTDGGSSWTIRTDNASHIHFPYTTTFSNTVGECLVDVTNTSNVKVRFQIQVADNNTSVEGAQDANATYFTFIRLGDT